MVPEAFQKKLEPMKHGRSREHQRAIPIAEQKQDESTTLELFERHFLEQEKAILAALTNVYWLAKEVLPLFNYSLKINL